jgi:hypothetical protein
MQHSPEAIRRTVIWVKNQTTKYIEVEGSQYEHLLQKVRRMVCDVMIVAVNGIWSVFKMQQITGLSI